MRHGSLPRPGLLGGGATILALSPLACGAESSMDEETYEGLLENAGAMGFDVTRIQTTTQGE